LERNDKGDKGSRELNAGLNRIDNLKNCSHRTCPWQVQKAADYRIITAESAPEEGPKLTLLLQVDGGGHAGEGFRFAVDGGPWNAVIWTRDLLDPPDLGRYQLHYQVKGEDIDLRPNSFSSRWEDVDTLLGKKYMMAGRAGDDEDRTTEFRGIFAAEKAEDPNLGAAVRWTVQATPQGGLRLILQGLPGGARRLRSDPHLAADETEAITLDYFDAQVDTKETTPCKGPIPVLFARDPASVTEILNEQPQKVHTGNQIWKIN
jgi:hypothetical protein